MDFKDISSQEKPMYKLTRIAVIALPVAFILFSCSDQGNGYKETSSSRANSSSNTESQILTPADIARKVFPSVLLLTLADKDGQPISLGSGFWVADGIIATNYHVIERAASGFAKRIGQKERLTILGLSATDEEHDLALLAVNSDAPKLPLADSVRPEVGETVYAVGNPHGLEGTFSTGIISGIRSFGDDFLVQLTAPISPGSSGGPVLNTRGQVLGVATATIREGQNLNFAVPSQYVHRLLKSVGKPVPLGSPSTIGKKSFTARLGSPTVVGVVGEAFRWQSSYDGQYSFTLINKLSDPVHKVVALVIFYDRQGNPLEADSVDFDDAILPGLGRRVRGRVDESVRDLTTNPSYASEPSTRVEFRVLGFEIYHPK